MQVLVGGQHPGNQGLDRFFHFRFSLDMLNFEVVGKISSVEIIATGKSIREYKRLAKFYGRGRWRKLKGISSVKLHNGRIHLAELHWYEAHGIGRKEIKIKRILA